jgi:hypothetical protein
MISTHFPFLGNSTICPSEALTSKFDHKIFVIVFDFAGDSTITRFLAILMLTYKFTSIILNSIKVEKNCKREKICYLLLILILDLITGIESYRKGTEIFTLPISSYVDKM